MKKAKGIAIDKGVPIPPKTRGTKFPIEDLEVGDSFCVVLPADPVAEKKLRNSIAGRVNYYQNKLSIRCITRSVIEKRVMKIRVWRTK